MRIKQKILFLVTTMVMCIGIGEAFAQTQYNSESNEIFLADPTVFYHDGLYYLYGTGGRDVNEGFLVYTSTNLKNWEGPKGTEDGFALRKADAFGDKGFWAPQVFRHKDKFYMAYTANENIAIAVSESPLGPFKQQEHKALVTPVKQIDPFVFMDSDGKKYLYHVRLTNGNRIFVAELSDDLSEIKQETLRECISATEPWENTANANWPVAEGPTVLKHKGLYYLIYSANDFRNPDYAVGYATSKSPLGPWVKSKSNPILSKNSIGENGTGHGDIFKNKKGEMYYVFHTHHSGITVAPRKTALVKALFEKGKKGTGAEDKLKVDTGSFYFPLLKSD